MERFSHLHLDGQQKETITYQNQMIHYGLYQPRPEAYFFSDIPWHWHDEFEFGYLSGGSLRYKTNNQECILHEGDGIFINSGSLHYLQPLEPKKDIRLQSQFFDKSFLSGASGSFFDIKYIAPVKEQRQLEMVPLYGSNPEHKEFLDKMQEAANLGTERKDFFELRLQRIFSELWETVYSWAMSTKKNQNSFNTLEDERIKQLLLFIQAHFNEKITVSMIAGAIPISERECYRLFQNKLDITPSEYITSLRMQKAQELLMHSDKGVLEIALETGFGSSSYFGKLFKQHHHITPKQYQKLSGIIAEDH